MSEKHTMDCTEAGMLIPLLLDDELDAEQSLRLEGHLDVCSHCQQELEREGELRLALRRAAERVVAPAALRARIADELSQSQTTERRWTRWVPMAAAAVFMMFLGFEGLYPDTSRDLEAVTARHARNLPMDVAAGEWREVQSYLNGRLPFSVRKPALRPARGMNLEGGRVTQLGNREAAWVRYRMRDGRVSMFVYQDSRAAESDLSPLYRMGKKRVSMDRMRGLNIARWRDGDLVYSIVTDLPESDLRAVLRAQHSQ